MAGQSTKDLMLYTDNRLPCPQRVLLTATELGLELTTINIDILKNGHKTPEYSLLTNNFNAVPFLTSTTSPSFTLRESRAISRYLCVLSSLSSTQTLLPPTTDLLATAKFEEAASMEVTSFDPVANRLVFEAYFKPLFGEKTDEHVVKELRGRLEGVLDGMERVLGSEGRKYMAGETFTLADIFYVPYMIKFVVLYGEEVFKGRERSRDWWERVRVRESVALIKTYGLDADNS